MAAGLTQHGLSLGGVVTQGLTQSELFRHEDASSKWGRPQLVPVLHPLQVSFHALTALGGAVCAQQQALCVCITLSTLPRSHRSARCFVPACHCRQLWSSPCSEYAKTLPCALSLTIHWSHLLVFVHVYAQVPVRAVVLPLLDHEAAMQLHSAVRHALQQVVAEDSVWYQDDSVMHATLYHASTHGVGKTLRRALVSRCCWRRVAAPHVHSTSSLPVLHV
jgi:hypothetical protein